MVCSNKFFTAVYLAIVYASTTVAMPWPPTSKYATHCVRDINDDVKVEAFHPRSTYETYPGGIDHQASKGDNPNLEHSAISFVGSKLKVESSSIKFSSGLSGDSAKHAWLRQVHDGVPFANAVANVAFNNDEKVVAFGTSFVKPASFPSSKPSISVQSATETAEKNLKGKFNGHPPAIEYFAKHDGSVALTHAIQIRNEQAGTWYEAFVDAHTGELLSITDFVAKASYRVLPIYKELPYPEDFKTIVDPQDLSASPLGWHDDGHQKTTTTSGNNVITYKGFSEVPTNESSSPLKFEYVQNPAEEPTTSVNVDAARVNAFYTVNSIHDFAYKYGFTEAAFNFQTNNFGRPGQGDDQVTVSVQDGASINNADFATPPDGESGHMRMFLWDRTTPHRDGALENDIIIHEMCHGISNRMTGGGSASCLQTTESRGMGEGWSDMLADWTWQSSTTTQDFAMGQYVVNNVKGIRRFPYSTSTATNPLRYSSVGQLNEVHNIGEVWANMLHNLLASLVTKRGFSDKARTDPTSLAGNVMFLHLVMDGFLLQPCNPTFVQARDAIIQADHNRYKGSNKCLLWKTFASRGLGVRAVNYKDDSSVPDGC